MGYQPSDEQIDATVAALNAYLITQGTVHDEHGEYLYLAQRAGIVDEKAQEVPSDFWDNLMLRMVKGKDCVKKSDHGVLIPDKHALFPAKDVVFLDALGNPITD